MYQEPLQWGLIGIRVLLSEIFPLMMTNLKRAVPTRAPPQESAFYPLRFPPLWGKTFSNDSPSLTLQMGLAV